MIRVNEQNQIILTGSDGFEEVFDFNSCYSGYYPSCHFTAAGHLGGWDYLAGTDASGMAHLFAGRGKNIWEERNITSRFSSVGPDDYGNILSILTEEVLNQVFLLSENGYLITASDCPKCVRVRRISSEKLSSAEKDGDCVCFQDIHGAKMQYPLSAAAWFRCSWTYAARYLPDRGLLLDLRDKDSRERFSVPWAIPFQMDLSDHLIDRCPKDHPLFFLCERGIKADETVQKLREHGFLQAYSLGGEGDILLDCEAFSYPHP